MSGGKGGGGSTPNQGISGTVQQSTTSSPWSGQAPYLSSGFQQAGNLYNSGGPQYYPGQTYAPATAAQTSGLNQIAGIGANGTDASNAASGASSRILDHGFLGSNPGNSIFGNFASGSMNSAQNPYFKQMADTVAGNVLPQINAPFAAGNRMDSGLASRAQGLGLGDAIGGLAYQNYNQGLQNQLTGAAGLSGNYNTQAGQQIGAIGQAPNINNMQLGNAQAGVQAGNQQQGLDQQSINDALARFNYGQQQPYNNLNNYMQTIQGNYGSSGTQNTPYFQSQLAQANAAASGIGSLASNPMFKGLGAQIGIGNGGIFGPNGIGKGGASGSGSMNDAGQLVWG